MTLRSLARGLTLDRLIGALLVVGLAAAAATTGFDGDTWWQLRSGQLTWQSGYVWTTDPLSFTALGNPWPNHEWLSQLLFYGCFCLGGAPALVALATAAITATWLAVGRLCPGPVGLRASLLALGAVSQSVFWSVRPHLFTMLALAVLLLLLRSRRGQLGIPPLFLIWANLHGGVAFGGAVLVLGAAAAVVYDRRSWARWLALLVASALATLCTPLGLGLWSFAVSMIAHPQTAYIREWLPPSLSWPASYPFLALAALWAGLIGLRWRVLGRRLLGPEGAWALTLLLAGAALLVMGSRAIRHTALFSIVALPQICDLAADLLPERRPAGAGQVSLARGTGHFAALLLAALLAAAAVAASWQATAASRRPLAAGAVDAVRACQGHLFNTYVLGGPVLWFIPERPVFVDSRNDPYPLDLLYSAVIIEQSADYAELFARYRVSCVLAGRTAPLTSALDAAPGWERTYADAQVAVFARR